jgi:hypothetical protein
MAHLPPPTRLLLVHSPLVVPASWDLIAPALAEPAREVTIPDLTSTIAAGPPWCSRQAELIARAAAGRRPTRNAVNLFASVGVSRVTGILSAAECNKAPFMYEMKGALSGCGPGSASFPASRLRVSQSPGLTVPDRLVSQPHQSRSTGRPASLFRFVRLPGLPGATRRPPVPGTRCKFRFPGLYIAPGETPWMVPVSCGESISTPSAQRRARAHRNSF